MRDKHLVPFKRGFDPRRNLKGRGPAHTPTKDLMRAIIAYNDVETDPAVLRKLHELVLLLAQKEGEK